MTTTILALAFVHTLINGILIGALMSDIQDAYKNSRFNWFITILFLFIVLSVFSLFLVEISIVFIVYAFFTGDHFNISKYKLYILGLNIYFRPYIIDEWGEKVDLYQTVKKIPSYKLKSFWLFDVVYRDEKYCKEHNINTL